MKNIFIKVLLMLITIALIVFSMINVVDIFYNQYDNYTYQILEDGTIKIIDAKSSQLSEIIVPNEINDYQVSVIGQKAYNCVNCYTLIISSGIKEIEPEAFYNCQTITTLNWPADLIAENSLKDLTDLQELVITSNGNISMADYENEKQRSYCHSLNTISSIVVDYGVNYLSNYAFSNMPNLGRIEIPETVTSIGDYCFHDSNISSLKLPLSLHSIGSKALAMPSYDNKATILLPQNINYFGEDALGTNNCYYAYVNSKASDYLIENALDYIPLDINFVEDKYEMYLGDKIKVSLREGYQFENDIYFASENEDIVTIDGNGNLIAHNVGETYITAHTSSGLSKAKVIVNNLSNEYLSKYLIMSVGQKYETNLNDFMTTGESKISYYDPEVLTIEDKTIKAIKKGRSKVVINDKWTYIVDVNQLVSEIRTNKETVNLTRGQKTKLSCTAYPTGADNRYLTYSSLDETIATVNQKGEITAMRNGSTEIIVRSNDGSNITKNIAINVSNSTISTSSLALPLMPNKSFYLRANCSDGSTAIFSTNNEDIATVSSNGKITAHKSGECFINITNATRTAFTSVPIKVYDALYYGCDLSEWNGRYYNVNNFIKMKDFGIDFVYLRAALDDEYKDPIFERNYQNAKSAGLDIGAYHYIKGTTVEYVTKEAQFMVETIKGKQFEYPIMIDIEDQQHKNLSNQQFNEIVNAYCKVLEDAGYKTIVYSYASLLNKTDGLHDCWVAHWGVTSPYVFKGEYTIWQFSSVGRVDGLNNNVDMDICFFDYPSYIKNNHLNGY